MKIQDISGINRYNGLMKLNSPNSNSQKSISKEKSLNSAEIGVTLELTENLNEKIKPNSLLKMTGTYEQAEINTKATMKKIADVKNQEDEVADVIKEPIIEKKELSSLIEAKELLEQTKGLILKQPHAALMSQANKSVPVVMDLLKEPEE